MWKVRGFLFLAVCLLKYSLANSYHVNDQLEKDEIIDAVNNAKTTWKAGRNFHPFLKNDYLKILLGLKKDKNKVKLPTLQDIEDDIELPESFDARKKWRYCTGLQTVRDQGNCGSCWAVSSASVFTDRLCIASKGQFNGQLSAAELMSCDPYDRGCNGGDLTTAFKFFETHGIVTGGDYKSYEGCQPYPFPKCDHHTKGKYTNCSGKSGPIPACMSTCSNKEYKSHSFQKDLHFIEADSSFLITGSGNVKQMQREIYRHGPLAAAFFVYEDFLSYHTGVYIQTSEIIKGGHAVKIIGWGVENGTDYWLVANSWNEDWGRHKGFFKIRRGSNECGFENEVVGGTPKVHQ